MNSDEIVKLLGDPQLSAACWWRSAWPRPSTLSRRHFLALIRWTSDEVRRRRAGADQGARAAAAKVKGATLRHEHKRYMKEFVERLSLSKWLNTRMRRCDWRARLSRPAGGDGVSVLSRGDAGRFVHRGGSLFKHHQRPRPHLADAIGGGHFRRVHRHQISGALSHQHHSEAAILDERAFPDSLDLMLICVESGMSIEHAFRKVGQEVGAQSPELAEEFALATAELSFLPDRRTAYLNLVARTGLDGVKQICTC